MERVFSFDQFSRDKNTNKFHLNSSNSDSNVSHTFQPKDRPASKPDFNSTAVLNKNIRYEALYSDSEDEENIEEDEVFLSMVYHNGKLSCSYYVNLNSTFVWVAFNDIPYEA